MKFKDYKYERVDIDKLIKDLIQYKVNFDNAENANEQIKIIREYNSYMDLVDSMFQLAMIRYSIDTTDKFYEEEQNFLDEKGPMLSEYSVEFDKSILNSKFRNELEKEFGVLLFQQLELGTKIFNPSIIELLQEENKLNSEYMRLKGGAKILFDGKEYTLSSMTPLTTNKDRQIRRNATIAVSNWYNENEKSFDEIYDKVVKVRHEIALKLGYENFIQLGYDRMNRVDYNQFDVKKYREQILADVVPYVKELHERKTKRLKMEKLLSYDLNLSFLSGNPTPKGDKDFQVQQAIKMYDEMSPETSKFFRFLVDSELLDLESKPGKNSGGYCTYIPKYEAPFIFANFNGTQGDVDVLTHEAGHAFQVYSSRNNLPSQRWPGYEGAEIHSMSMEFLAWPWMENFFKEDTNKYKFSHLAGAIEFLPYGALVDHFQHEVYLKPNMTANERKTLWMTLEAKYQPWKQYDQEDAMNKGIWWFKQGHIFESPFYYIDYTLAQVIAFDFWGRNQIDRVSTWNNYHELCKLGGSKSFVALLEATNLPNPFKDNTIKRIMEPLKQFLNNVDDLSY